MRIILIAAFLFSPAIAIAEETVPIPKKRPKVLSVSPEYIEQLKNRERTSTSSPSSELFIDVAVISEKLSNIEPATGKSEERISRKIEAIPRPLRKPISTQNEPKEQRLVSFTLTPEEIELNENIKLFLENHALDIFKQDFKTRLDIQAYASSQNNSENSSSRLALARALEIRKFLLTKNIDPSRIKLTPKGLSNKNSDRIDLVFIDDNNNKF